MSYSLILKQIYNILASVTGIGRVYDYPRWGDDVITKRDLFLIGAINWQASFESDADSFTNTGTPDTAERSTTRAVKGSYSYKVAKTANSWAGVQRNLSVTSGNKYQVECKVYVSSGAVSDVQLKINTNNAGFSDADISPDSTGKWLLLRTTVSQAAATGTDQVQLLVKNTAEAYFDEVRVIEWTETNQIFHVWFPERIAAPAEAFTDGQTSRTHEWILWGYYEVDDSKESEKTFQGLIDTVMDDFDNIVQLQNEGDQLDAAELASKEDVMFAGVLCHRAQIKIATTEEIG